MIYLFRYLIGYVKFTFRGGFCEDFLNQCYREQLRLRNVRQLSDGLCAECSVKTYRRLHRIARECGGVNRIYRKRGLPFLVPQMKRRLGFFVGLLLFVVTLSFLHAFIWSVEIVGNEQISSERLRYYLADNGVASGALWSSVDRSRTAWQMLADFDELSWVHINKDGARAIVEVREVTPPDTDYDVNVLEGNTAFTKTLQATAYREQSHITVSRQRAYYRLRFFTLDTPLYFKKEAGDTSATRFTPLTLFGTELPVGITEELETYYRSEPYTLTDGEAAALAEEKLKRLEEQELSDWEIVNSSTDTVLDDDKATATGTYILR